MSVCVDPSDDLELRMCRITNLGHRTRRIELTSYIEFVLARPEVDESHPTFSKLFIETEFCSEQNAILARRRPRSAAESEQWACHCLVCGDAEGLQGGIQFETNRASFIGRGRTLARPRALDPTVKLRGEWGAVLDPVGSLRTTVSLAPAETRQIVWTLGSARGRHEIERLASKVTDFVQAQTIFAAAAQSGTLLEGNGKGNGSERDRSDKSMAGRLLVHPAHTSAKPSASAAKRKAIYRPAFAGSEREAAHQEGKPELLRFDNGYGGFSADGREYVIRLQPDDGGGHQLPPRPWVNVIANESAGFLVTERGAGYTWVGNSRNNRLTAWHNDPVCDPHAEAIWIRDEEARTFWSVTPGPTPAGVPHEVRHGFGYTTFQHVSHGIEQELTLFMAPDEPVKLARVRLVNRGRVARQLSLFSYAHLALGTLAAESVGSVTTEFDTTLSAILARNPSREHFESCVAFSAIAADDADDSTECYHTDDRSTFLGELGQLESAAALTSGQRLDNRTGSGLDPCAAWQVPIELAAGNTYECTILLGEATTLDRAAELIRKYRRPEEVQRALDQAKEFWCETLSAVQVQTPDAEIDLLVNGWLTYQNLSCRMWGRSAYYQPGGAFGFRDQLQDAAALVYYRPDLTRRQLVCHASQQFIEGDVLHWWHPETGAGLRTRFSDDLLWLPYIAATYIAVTGDEQVLDEAVPFVSGPTLGDEQQEAYLHIEPTDETATIYEHCCRAIDRGLTTGAHGLPLFGCGDWNDGMNRVGSQGRGESVWLGFFIASVLKLMLPICERRNDWERAKRYQAYRDQLLRALDKAGWDGSWYRRAYYDDGEPLGSAKSDECQIDALAQAWAVLSGVASKERAELSVAEVEKRLVDEEAGIIRLLAPPFDRTTHDPGYIKGYLPGIRENGGQYTHGVLWFVRAMAELGRGTRAVELLKMLSPISHTSTPDDVAIYQTEPYVVAADVYGEPPHVGRGGWTWYTGSAGWMLRVAIESIFGFSIDGGQWLVINPTISAKWPRCRLSYRVPGVDTRYEITIENPKGKERGVVAATVDGNPANVSDGAARVPLLRDGRRHEVVVRM
jgi:cyclic beta-1,2-glucan synthetase